MQVPCTQCGGSVELAQGILFFSCSYCKSALYLDPSGTVFHFVISPLISFEESSGKLKRWMAGNETAKDLDVHAKVTHHELMYFPMWRFVTREGGLDREFSEPAGAFVIPDLQKIPLSGGNLKFFNPEEFADKPLREPEVLLESALQWLSARGVQKENVKETNLIHIPFYVFHYTFKGEEYRAVVDGVSGRVLAAIYPARLELPFVSLTAVACILFFLEGVLSPSFIIRIFVYFITMIPVGIAAYTIVKKY